MCSFSVAVNRKRTQNNQNPETDFVNVTAWRQLGENCAKYLTKGSKVCASGAVSVRLFNRVDGTAGASMEVQAREVEFLSQPNANNNNNQDKPETSEGFTQVESEGLPF